MIIFFTGDIVAAAGTDPETSQSASRVGGVGGGGGAGGEQGGAPGGLLQGQGEDEEETHCLHTVSL